ncbi:MAG: response regulator transcription factor [Rhodobacteraceae bacterium]|nr:response regulator transcription factor [Paracoccaceae bacterium]
MLNIALVEDNTALRESIVDMLAEQGHHVVGFESAEGFLANCSVATVDVVVLDLNLPGRDGLSLARDLRAAWPKVGIIMLTARGAPEERQTGYESGADIYLAKPSSAPELTASIWALARRLGREETAPRRIVLDVKAMTLSGPSGTVKLTSGEASLLESFVQAPGNRLVTEGQAADADATSKATLGVKIVRLRKKLVAAGAVGQPINAIRNLGYQLSVSVDLS